MKVLRTSSLGSNFTGSYKKRVYWNSLIRTDGNHGAQNFYVLRQSVLILPLRDSISEHSNFAALEWLGNIRKPKFSGLKVIFKIVEQCNAR